MGTCNMDEILKIANENDLKLIEDCSHAHALYDNKKIGSLDISCFSLQEANIAACEGGISTNNEEYLLRMSIYGHFDRHKNELKDVDNLKSIRKQNFKNSDSPFGDCLANVDFDNLNILNNYKEKFIEELMK